MLCAAIVIPNPQPCPGYGAERDLGWGWGHSSMPTVGFLVSPSVTPLRQQPAPHHPRDSPAPSPTYFPPREKLGRVSSFSVFMAAAGHGALLFFVVLHPTKEQGLTLRTEQLLFSGC